MREEIIDKLGNAVYLTDERFRTRGLIQLYIIRKRLQFLFDGLDHIEVVVAFRWQMDKPNNFVITAYPKEIVANS